MDIHLHDIKLTINKTMGTQFGFKLKRIKNTSSVTLPGNAIEGAGQTVGQLDISVGKERHFYH